MCVQVLECQYPHREPLSVRERLKNEVEYRLLQLLKWREEEEEEVVEEGEVRIKLDSLLQYQHIGQLCSNVEEIK